MRCLISVLLVLTFGFSAWGQTNISGVISDSISNQRLSFVNIGIRHTSIGTRSSVDGLFSLVIPQQYENDTLLFSMMGYEAYVLPIKKIKLIESKIILLKQAILQLPDIKVSAKRLVEKKFGIANSKSLLHFTDGIVESNDFLEIAQLMRLDPVLSKITSVHLYINSSNKDSATFRINFYKFDENKPGQQLTDKNIIQTHPVKAGWLTFDLTSYDIYLKGDVVVSIELIPTKPNPERILYEVKLGGSSKSFLKTSPMGDWAVPPHHFRLFITALVDSDRKSRRDESDENETLATTTMYSKFVQDSFSIFINLPKGYEKNKIRTYPTVYLLDANAYQDIVIGTTELLRKKYKMPDVILVGIGYKDVRMMDSLRNRDYTFPKALPVDSFPVSGGADKFLAFIEKELIPAMDTRYRTEGSNRTIMGHSLGGYFTLFAFDADMRGTSHVFKNYVAASPSIMYSKEYLVKQFQTLNEFTDHTPRLLFLTIGSKEERTTGTSFNDFLQMLKPLERQQIIIENEVFMGLGHMETAVPTFEKGLQFIFSQINK